MKREIGQQPVPVQFIATSRIEVYLRYHTKAPLIDLVLAIKWLTDVQGTYT